MTATRWSDVYMEGDRLLFGRKRKKKAVVCICESEVPSCTLKTQSHRWAEMEEDLFQFFGGITGFLYGLGLAPSLALFKPFASLFTLDARLR